MESIYWPKYVRLYYPKWAYACFQLVRTELFQLIHDQNTKYLYIFGLSKWATSGFQSWSQWGCRESCCSSNDHWWLDSKAKSVSMGCPLKNFQLHSRNKCFYNFVQTTIWFQMIWWLNRMNFDVPIKLELYEATNLSIIGAVIIIFFF